MFWIGMIVGIVIMFVSAKWLGAKCSNMSVKEFSECARLVIDAGWNRESAIMVCGDNEFFEIYRLEEK